MQVTSAESTQLFVGDLAEPLQLVRVTYAGTAGRVRIEGDGLRTAEEPREAGDGVLEVPVHVERPVPGQRRVARVLAGDTETPFEFEVAEVVSHVHFGTGLIGLGALGLLRRRNK